MQEEEEFVITIVEVPFHTWFILKSEKIICVTWQLKKQRLYSSLWKISALTQKNTCHINRIFFSSWKKYFIVVDFDFELVSMKFWGVWLPLWIKKGREQKRTTTLLTLSSKMKTRWNNRGCVSKMSWKHNYYTFQISRHLFHLMFVCLDQWFSTSFDSLHPFLIINQFGCAPS